MTTTYDVRIWKTEVYAGKRTTTYTVRWGVAGKPWKEPFRTKALAESFRSDLVAAARKGEAFVVETGRPVSMSRTENEMSWFDFACAYVDMKWGSSAGNSRKGVAETLSNATFALLATSRNKPSDEDLRRALQGWAFNVHRRDVLAPPHEVRLALKWVAVNTLPVSALEQPRTARAVLDRIAQKLDGSPAAASVVKRKRAVLHNAFDYALELGLLDRNPMKLVKWSPPKTMRAVDRRVVVNPEQAKRLLEAVAAQQPSGPQLVAFFAVMYYSAARPGEAVNVRKHDLILPREGWGEILLSESAPETGAAWSETGTRRDRRSLKHRAKGETRLVPCPPQLTALLQRHIEAFGFGSDGLLFRGVRGGQLSESTYSRAWRAARESALSVEEAASPLARRAYDLRHAAVSTWLNGGVAPTQVAEWAGHSVAVLLQVYAKCLAGQEDIARKRVEAALGG